MLDFKLKFDLKFKGNTPKGEPTARDNRTWILTYLSWVINSGRWKGAPSILRGFNPSPLSENNANYWILDREHMWSLSFNDDEPHYIHIAQADSDELIEALVGWLVANLGCTIVDPETGWNTQESVRG